MLKTVAALASGEGGTVIFGVTDDAEAIGIRPPDADKCMLTVGSMIRDSITPEPRYQLRTTELDGHLLLLAEVSPGNRWYAYNPAKPEFYVRRGASTVPARMDEIATGFRPEQDRRLRR
jgi:predicted HTH transcriptional regulator